MISKHKRHLTSDVRHQTGLSAFRSVVCGLLSVVCLSSALAQKPPTKIDIKTKEVRAGDLTKEQCLQRIYGIHLSKDLRGAKMDEVNISGANLAFADLSEASLKKSILKNTRLNRADLTKANLENAILYQADLSGAKLANANLKNANLTKADLKNASMVGANLNNAVLIEADLSGANLTGATLEGAKTNGTVFSGTIMPDGRIHPSQSE